MFRCRLIRTVVNVLLIVAVMIQPGMAYVFAGDCGAKCASSSFICEGCGCCTVSTPTEMCGCCGGSAEPGAGGSCCMGSSEPPDDEIADNDELASEESLELRVIVISITDAVITDAPSDQQLDEVTSTCRCGVESQPIGDSSPLRPTIERRDSIAVRFAELATIFGDAVPRSPRTAGDDDAFSSPHFSQVHLCIWRL